MIKEPRDLFEKLEFDKIILLLEKECLGEQGKEAIRTMPLHTDAVLLEQLLTEVSEFKLSLEEKDYFPISVYEDISEDLRMLAVEGYVLPVEGLQRVNNQLLITAAAYKFFTAPRKEIYPSLLAILSDVQFDESLHQLIDKIIDENGDIRPNASPDLQKIRRQLGSKQRELERQFRIIINEYKSKGWLSDSVESFRNGRRVLSVPSEHKRKIRGIIHDESTTGKTAFIEPEAIIDINNDIFDLETEEKREIYRILRELSAQLRPYVPAMRQYQDLLIRFDVISAKAKLAVRLKASKPKLKPEPRLGIKTGFHPLLYLKNKETDKKTIPFDLILFNQNRVLMLSGPNAGGKSITMKSAGLLRTARKLAAGEVFVPSA
ncbi:MAG: endonuclease MutS2, partial [Bacteroidota bacterium]